MGGAQTQLAHGAGVTVDHQDLARAHRAFKQQPEAADEVGDDLLDAEADTHRQAPGHRHQGGAIDADVVRHPDDADGDQRVAKNHLQRHAALGLHAEEAAPEPGDESCRTTGQGDDQIDDHQGREQFADRERYPKYITEGNQRERFPAAQHVEKGEDRNHQKKRPEDCFIDLFHRNFGKATQDQLLCGFQTEPQHPEQSQILHKASCDASHG